MLNSESEIRNAANRKAKCLKQNANAQRRLSLFYADVCDVFLEGSLLRDAQSSTKKFDCIIEVRGFPSARAEPSRIFHS